MQNNCEILLLSSRCLNDTIFICYFVVLQLAYLLGHLRFRMGILEL